MRCACFLLFMKFTLLFLFEHITSTLFFCCAFSFLVAPSSLLLGCKKVKTSGAQKAQPKSCVTTFSVIHSPNRPEFQPGLYPCWMELRPHPLFSFALVRIQHKIGVRSEICQWRNGRVRFLAVDVSQNGHIPHIAVKLQQCNLDRENPNSYSHLREGHHHFRFITRLSWSRGERLDDTSYNRSVGNYKFHTPV